MEKEIIGYKLKEDCKQYEEVAKKISGFSEGGITPFSDFLINTNTNINNNGFIIDLKKAGVLDLWFEPIYEEEQFKVGDYLYLIKNKDMSANIGAISKFVQQDDKYIYVDWIYNSNDQMNGSYYPEHFRLATPAEIKEAELEELLNEAKKRYPKGTKFKPSSSNTIYEVIGELKWWNGKDNSIHSVGGHGLIYTDGKWAEIITTPDITINGYKGEFFDEYVKFGCAIIAGHDFRNLNDAFNEFGSYKTNKDIKSIKIGAGEFTTEQIKEIAEYYFNNLTK